MLSVNHGESFNQVNHGSDNMGGCITLNTANVRCSCIHEHKCLNHDSHDSGIPLILREYTFSKSGKSFNQVNHGSDNMHLNILFRNQDFKDLDRLELPTSKNSPQEKTKIFLQPCHRMYLSDSN